MEPNPTPPSFNLGYTAGTTNIGAGYAAGIQQAGQSIAQGLGGALDVANRRQNASDMLDALHQGGALSDQAYKSIYGKSLGAQEQMLGMYANQWILDQANQRAMSLARGQGGVDVAVQHAKLLDTIRAVQEGYGAAAGVQQQKLLWQPPAQQQNPPAQPPVQQNQPAPAPSQAAILAAQQQAGQYAGGPTVRGAPPNPTAAPRLPGTRYVQRTDPASGKVQTGTLYPSGTFISD